MFNFSYDEAKQVLIDNRSSSLYQDILKKYSNMDVLEDMLFEAIEYAVQHDTLIEADKRLKQGDIARLTSIAISLPYYLLTELYPNANRFAESFVLLCSNYFKMYDPQNPALNTFDVVSKLFVLEGNYTKLIVAAQALTAKMEKYINEEKKVNSVEEAISGAKDIIAENLSDVADYGLSRQFISTMLNEHIDKI